MSAAQNRAKRVLLSAWRWSPWITLPIVCLFGLWASRTHARFMGLGVRYGSSGHALDLHATGIYEYRRLRESLRIGLTERVSESGLPVVSLQLERDVEHSLNDYLPGSGREYQQGLVQYSGGEFGAAEVRYRGDWFWHWAGLKKSWRVKVPSESPWRGMQRFNLITPKGWGVLEDELSFWLAREMGLIAPQSELVELSINGENRGIHTLVEQPGLQMLEAYGRPDACILWGEFVGRDLYTGLSPRLFEHPGLWKVKPKESPAVGSARAALRELCDLLAQPASAPNLAAIAQCIDVQAMGRYAAFRVLTQTRHIDENHNWRLCFDPVRSKLEPLVWDTMGWYKNWMPVPGKLPYWEPLYNELDDRLAMDHDYRRAMHAGLREFWESGLQERFFERYDELVSTMEASLHRDPALSFKLKYVSAQGVQGNQKIVRGAMQQMLGDLRRVYLEPEPDLKRSLIGQGHDHELWRLRLQGRFATQGVRFEWPVALESAPPAEVTVTMEAGMEMTVHVELIPLGANQYLLPWSLLGGLEFVPNPAAQSYRKRGTMQPRAYTLDVRIERVSAQVAEVQALLPTGVSVPISLEPRIPVSALNGQFNAVGSDR